jgi:hypothetical protein
LHRVQPLAVVPTAAELCAYASKAMTTDGRAVRDVDGQAPCLSRQGKLEDEISAA